MGVWHMGQIASAMRLSTDRIWVQAPLWGTLTVLRTGLCHMDGCGARCQAHMGQSHVLRRGIWDKSSRVQMPNPNQTSLRSKFKSEPAEADLIRIGTWQGQTGPNPNPVVRKRSESEPRSAETDPNPNSGKKSNPNPKPRQTQAI